MSRSGVLRLFKDNRPAWRWVGSLVLGWCGFLCLFFLIDEKPSGALERRRNWARVRPRVVPARESVRPRNFILMIGDGMGLAHIALASHHRGRLALEDMPVAGFSYTHSLGHFTTDSAAAATALASGHLVENRSVGQHPDGTPTETVVEVARERGLRTGLVATSRITHATPASMAAHVETRRLEYDIARQLASSGIDVLLGGGWDRFTERPDGRNLVEQMQARGYRFVRTPAELSLASRPTTGRLLGLFSAGPMPKASEGRTPELAAMSLAALRVLAPAPEGFFLMIEGSQIDWGGHRNDSGYVAHETADFDRTLEAVLEFLDEAGIADETLVVVTADHETGGLALHEEPGRPLGVEPKWTTDGHTGVPVPLFARGPAAILFSGIQDHAEIGRKLIALVAGRAGIVGSGGK